MVPDGLLHVQNVINCLYIPNMLKKINIYKYDEKNESIMVFLINQFIIQVDCVIS